MYDTPDGWDWEREDADLEQAALEAEGRRWASGRRKMLALRAAGKLVEAAAACLHGGGYPLRSLAAEHQNDPRAGQSGFRCSECGSVLDRAPWHGPKILYPCEEVR